MALFLTRGSKKPKGKSTATHSFYVLRQHHRDRKTRTRRQRHIAYIGMKPEISAEKAERICKEKGITMDQLRGVKRLTILEAGSPAR